MEVFVTKAVLVVFLLCSLPALAQSQPKEANTIDFSNYPLSMHISDSHVGIDCSSSCKAAEFISATVEGNKYELESETFLPKNGIIALGDYHVKLINQKVKKTGEFQKTYELMFPDGSTRKFAVTGQTE